MMDIKEKSRVLANGVPLYSYRLPHTHSFVISVFLRAGCLFESENESGITHLFEHMVFRSINSSYGGRLYSTLDRYGLDFNATTYNEMVHFYISGVPSSFRVASEIISRVFDPISVSAAEFGAERDRIKAELREADERTSFASFARRCVWSGGPLSQSILGTASSVSRISRARLEKFRRRIVTAASGFVYVSGSFNDEDEHYLSGLVGEKDVSAGVRFENIAPVPENFGHRGPVVFHKNAGFTKLRMSFDIDMSRITPPELDLLHDMIFGGNDSPMFTELSERLGLFYDIDSSTERYNNIGVMHFTYELRSSRLYEALERTVELLRSFKQKEPSEERCMRIGYVEGADVLLDDPHELAFTLAYENHIGGLSYSGLEERKRAYSAVSAGRLLDVAREVLQAENATVIVFGKRTAIDVGKIKEIINKL